MPKYFPSAVKRLRETRHHIMQFGEPEEKDYFRDQVTRLLDELETIARKEVQLANASGRLQIGLGDHSVYMAVVRFRRKVNV